MISPVSRKVGLKLAGGLTGEMSTMVISGNNFSLGGRIRSFGVASSKYGLFNLELIIKMVVILILNSLRAIV